MLLAAAAVVAVFLAVGVAAGGEGGDVI